MLGLINTNVKTKAKQTQKLSLSGFKDNSKQLSVNQKFNKELQDFINGALPKDHIFQLGEPSRKLKDGGLQNTRIELSASRLENKSKQENHPFKLDKLFNLPDSLNNPIAVFDSTKRDESKVVLTELKDGKNNFVVIIRLANKKGRNRIEINDIKSLYPKSNILGVFDWITGGLTRWMDKKKAFSFVSVQSTNLIGNGNKSKSLSVTNIIQNFKNQNTEKDSKKTTTDKRTEHPTVKNTTPLSKWHPNTEIIKLKGELGKLIGGYEQNQFAIVLRGEKGAGKTRLLCQLINLFAKEKLNTLFLSLEVSKDSELFGKYASYIEKEQKKYVSVSSQNTLQELENYCKKFDVIAVDSWGKFKGVKQDDFIRLIEKYPNVIWLCIFQSTTAGTARGGIMSEYDSSIVIQVAKGGFAECEKNRYNSCDLVYSVFEQKLVTEQSYEN